MFQHYQGGFTRKVSPSQRRIPEHTSPQDVILRQVEAARMKLDSIVADWSSLQHPTAPKRGYLPEIVPREPIF